MTRSLSVHDLGLFETPEEVALSPDGSTIVYSVERADLATDRIVRELWLVGAQDGESRRLTDGHTDSSPAWAPSGCEIAFLRSDEAGAQIWLATVESGSLRQLTNRRLGAGSPAWDPTGSALAFVAASTVLENDADDSASPLCTERIDYRSDGIGLRFGRRTHLHVYDFGSSTLTQVTSGDWDVSSPAWSPDGAEVAFAAGIAEDADLRGGSALYAIDVRTSGATPELVALEQGTVSRIAWHPHGSELAVVGKLLHTVGHARLLLVGRANGDVKDLTASFDRNVMAGTPGYPGAAPQFTDDGGSLVFCVRDRGCTHVYRVATEGGTPELLLGDEETNVHGLSVNAHRAAILQTTRLSFGEVICINLRTRESRKRACPCRQLERVRLIERERREFVISDGTVVEGWITRDPSVVGPGPLLLDIHGGPHNAWNGTADRVHLYHQELANKGWTVLMLNPRGSDGYGEAFYTAALGAVGQADAPDFLEPLDVLVAEGIADRNRLAVAGYSYGGFMTCYLTSRDPRFCGAVAGGLICDPASMAGTSDMGHWISKNEYGGPPWADAGRYDAISPISQVDSVETPTLILHGERDFRCPLGQAQQWHSALRERRVHTQLVIYPRASHLFILNGRPSHRLDFNHRIVEWLEQCLRNR